MRKDIEIPKVDNIYVAANKEWDTHFTEQSWNVYLINNRKDMISLVLVMSQGNSEDRKTSTLRHDLGDIAANSAKKIEFISPDVFGFTNEYLITFFVEDKLFEGKFIFDPNSISDENVVKIPILESEGVLAK